MLYPTPIVAPKEPSMSSIPFTAALVLRNLARSKANRNLFWVAEAEFAYAMALQSANEGMAKVLGSILSELGTSLHANAASASPASNKDRHPMAASMLGL
jgi:hypothetical protein